MRITPKPSGPLYLDVVEAGQRLLESDDRLEDYALKCSRIGSGPLGSRTPLKASYAVAAADLERVVLKWMRDAR